MNLAIIEGMVRDGDLSLNALKYLIECRGECEWLDFKQELHLESNYQIASFAKDVLAMKNTGGGYLVVGVRDKTWLPEGMGEQLPHDAKLLRDKVRRATGLELNVDIVQHQLRYSGEPRWFALVLVRASRKRRKRRTPSLVRTDFYPKEPYGLRRGEIYFRRGDSTERLTDEQQLDSLLEELEERADNDSLQAGAPSSPFAVDDGMYRLQEKDYTLFVGRQALRDELFDAVTRDPRIWIINVHGPGGVGKSALTTWVTYKFYEERRFDAILQVTAKETVLALDRIARSSTRTLYSLEDLLDQILRLFGEEPPADLEEKKRLSLGWLSVGSTLLVLDNLETLDDGRILSFVQNLPPDTKAKVIVTSRRKTGAWEFPIAVSELSFEETRELAIVKANELDISINLDEKRVADIHTASGGLPLAIQWILGKYKLSGNLSDVLASVAASDSPLLEFSFRNIWNVLSPDARFLLALMSIFDEPPGHQQLAIATEFLRDRLENAMRELEDATLVSRQTHVADGQVVFSCLPITLSFARLQLQNFGDAELAARRRVQQYTHQIELRRSEVERFVGTFERYGIESDNEKRAVIFCRRGQSELFAGDAAAADEFFKQARDLAPTSSYVFALSASYELVRERIGAASRLADVACSRANKKTGSFVYSVKARICDAQRDKVGRVGALRKAVEFDPQDVVLRHQLGVSLSRLGEPWEAIRQFSEIISQEEGRDMPSETLLMALKTRIINLRRVGDTSAAEEDLERARELLRQYPHLSSQAHHIAELEE